MKVSKERLSTVAMQTGFRPEILEKVIRLMDLLNGIFNDDYLASRLALKGGTALNLFYFDLPRLSVDIDLNVKRQLSLPVRDNYHCRFPTKKLTAFSPCC